MRRRQLSCWPQTPTPAPRAPAPPPPWPPFPPRLKTPPPPLLPPIPPTPSPPTLQNSHHHRHHSTLNPTPTPHPKTSPHSRPSPQKINSTIMLEFQPKERNAKLRKCINRCGLGLGCKKVDEDAIDARWPPPRVCRGLCATHVKMKLIQAKLSRNREVGSEKWKEKRGKLGITYHDAHGVQDGGRGREMLVGIGRPQVAGSGVARVVSPCGFCGSCFPPSG